MDVRCSTRLPCAQDRHAILARELNGEHLHLDHGYPTVLPPHHHPLTPSMERLCECRIIMPSTAENLTTVPFQARIRAPAGRKVPAGVVAAITIFTVIGLMVPALR